LFMCSASSVIPSTSHALGKSTSNLYVRGDIAMKAYSIELFVPDDFFLSITGNFVSPLR
jgi:hypothetical protein